MGVVFRGFDAALNRFVAIKLLAPQWSADALARRRFTREAQAAAAVSHPHVVTIHAVNEWRGRPYLVMEYINGSSLQHRIDERGPLELPEILRIGSQVAAGLAAAHAKGLIHRDIKPGNIMLENDLPRVKLTDFGLARAVDDAKLTQHGALAGTPQYMAPEQARGERMDRRADLFSLGSVLYAMCAGRPAFAGESTVEAIRRVCDETPPQSWAGTPRSRAGWSRSSSGSIGSSLRSGSRAPPRWPTFSSATWPGSRTPRSRRSSTTGRAGRRRRLRPRSCGGSRGAAGPDRFSSSSSGRR